MERIKRLNKKGKVIVINAMCSLLSVLVILFAAITILSSLTTNSTASGKPVPKEESDLVLSTGGGIDLIGDSANSDSTVFVNLTDGVMAYKFVREELARMKANGYRSGGVGFTSTITKAPVIGDVTVSEIEYDNIIIDKNGNVSGEKGFLGKGNVGIAKENEVNNLKSYCYNKDTYIERDLGSNFVYKENGGDGKFVGDFTKAKVRQTTTAAEKARKGYLETPDIFLLNDESAAVESFKINNVRDYVTGYTLKLKLNDKALADFKALVKDSAAAEEQPSYNYFYLTFVINRTGEIKTMIREEQYHLPKNTIIGLVSPLATGSKTYNLVYNKPDYVVTVA